MALTSGLSVKKPISTWNRPLKANFKDAFRAVGKAGFDAATQNWVGVGKDAVDALAAVGLDGSKEPAELAWSLIYNSLRRAIFMLVGESQYLMKDIPSDIDHLTESLDLSFENNTLEITDTFFEHPEQLSIVQDIKKPLKQWFEGVGIEPFQAEVLSNHLPTYFVLSINDEWRRHSSDYGLITEQVKTPFTQADSRERGWLRYNAWLQTQIQEPMMFEAFGLSDVYVPLRAFFERKRGGGGEDEELLVRGRHGEHERHERIVVDLATELDSWLRAADKNDSIRVISGGPGSGKSSFAKILAAHHASQGTFPVLFIPLHQFDSSGDLIKSIGEFIRYDEYVKDNPVDPDNDELRLLIIFDGLDELAMQGKLAKEVAQAFIQEVQAKVSQFNRRKTRLQVVITGRDVAVQESFRDPCHILHVLPYFIPKSSRGERNREYRKYTDEAHLLDRDQRNDWWKKYAVATQREFDEMPTDLDRGTLTEITAQPLLNYLVAFSYVQNKLTLSETTNLNTIYSDLLNAVYDRGYEGKNRRHAAIGKLSRDEFIRVLEEIALAAWHGDGRTTTVKEIEEHCKSSGLKRLLDIFEEGAEAGVTRLLAAFYFRQSGDRSNERTFEFTHKSFGEYLTALRIVRAMERIQKQLDRRQEDMEEGWDDRQALQHWAEVCGPTRMDSYLLSFLKDEVALRDLGKLKKLQKTFGSLIGVMLRQGMPIEKLEPSLKFHEANRWAINAEEALLAALTACAQITQNLFKLDLPTPESFGAWIKRLQGQRTGAENVTALLSLSFLNLSHARLDFIDLYGVNLDQSSFARAHLYGANLRNTQLDKVNFRKARFTEPFFRRAQLSETNFQQATFRGADFGGARLARVNFVDVRFDEPIFNRERQHYYLYGPIFTASRLSHVNFQGARLNGADFRGASLNYVNFENACLDGANFSGARLDRSDLKGASLRDIVWDERTDWGRVRNLNEAVDVPEAIREELSKGIRRSIFSDDDDESIDEILF